VFRILYFMIPFGIAISIMGSREIWLNVVVPWQKRRKLNEASIATASVEEAEVAQVKTLRFDRRSRMRSRR
jgi:glycosyltransferase 2 family protein